jgi:hypothetical protein
MTDRRTKIEYMRRKNMLSIKIVMMMMGKERER